LSIAIERDRLAGSGLEDHHWDQLLGELPEAVWRRDPDRERRLKDLALRKIELDRQLALLDKQHAMLDWIESEIDLIEADLPSTSTPPPPIDASLSVS